MPTGRTRPGAWICGASSRRSKIFPGGRKSFRSTELPVPSRRWRGPASPPARGSRNARPGLETVEVSAQEGATCLTPPLARLARRTSSFGHRAVRRDRDRLRSEAWERRRCWPRPATSETSCSNDTTRPAGSRTCSTDRASSGTSASTTSARCTSPDRCRARFLTTCPKSGWPGIRCPTSTIGSALPDCSSTTCVVKRVCAMQCCARSRVRRGDRSLLRRDPEMRWAAAALLCRKDAATGSRASCRSRVARALPETGATDHG